MLAGLVPLDLLNSPACIDNRGLWSHKGELGHDSELPSRGFVGDVAALHSLPLPDLMQIISCHISDTEDLQVPNADRRRAISPQRQSRRGRCSMLVPAAIVHIDMPYCSIL